MALLRWLHDGVRTVARRSMGLYVYDKTADRPEFQSCMGYLREGDTLIITRLDRLARSVVHLAQLAARFQSENINLLVLDQSIDTSTSTGRMMFNMLTSLAEFETDLRSERQAEGIAKARENGVKFGRPNKVTEALKTEIYSRRLSGATIGQLAKEFSLGEATIYRALNTVKSAGAVLPTDDAEIPYRTLDLTLIYNGIARIRTTLTFNNFEYAGRTFMGISGGYQEMPKDALISECILLKNRFDVSEKKSLA